MLKKFNSHLSIGTRLSIMSGVFVVTAASLATVIGMGQVNQLNVAHDERDGGEYLKAIWSTLDAPAVQIAEHEAWDARFGSSSQYAAFAASEPGLARLQAADALLTQVAAGSGITLDAEYTTYYLGDALSARLPELLVREAELDAVSGASPVELSVSLTRLDDTLEQAEETLQAALNNAGGDPLDGLAEKITALSGVTERMMQEERAGGGPNQSTTEADFPRIAHDIAMSGADNFTRLMDDRIHSQERALALSLLLSLGGILLSCGLAYATSRGLGQRFKALGYTMDDLVNGKTDVEIPFGADLHETGKIASTLKSMREGLAAQQSLASESNAKGSAFTGSSVAMMVIDRDFKVTYANDATKKLFTDNLTAFRQLWPSFNPEAIIGTCIDMFHKNPAHQRQLLSDPSRLPYRTDINVGDLKISLNVSAVFDAKRNYVGNVLEWDNVTETRVNAGMLNALDRSQAVIEFSLDGRILKANKNFLDTLGYTMEEVRGQHHSIFVDPVYRASPEYRAFWDRLARGEYQADKYRRIAKGGREVWIQASYNPILDGNGKPFKVVKFATDVTQVEHERVRAEEERAVKSKAQALVVESLANGLNALSDGDLTARLSTPFQADYEQLRTDFNAALEKLQLAMGTIVTNAGGIRTGAGEISQAADDLSRRTEQQAASLEETAAALDEITATVRKTAEGAKQANGVVAATRSDAEASGQVVRETVAAMGEIEKSAKQISQIIGVIDEIAFQTNLLALNAGVEAARAGEAGRGFAVVASEVRALAQRSSEAAKEIKALISTSSQHVETGVELVGEAGKALEVIVNKVGEISGLVGEIAASAQEQATALAEVNTAINQMDQVTQQNAAMVEESTAASHSLTQEANELGELVARFKTGEHAAPVGAARTPVQPVAAQRQRVAKFAATRAAAATAKAEDDWQEF
ncbi:methyl-accepting chemotaxis protein [Terricaulis sp.]|uniref:methyl-accepting chemotaxis protein n=1 Tax=Terricaulis sp. TaxID=2768686 RepID=UPI003784F756